MQIANPIYDVVFKFLLEDSASAKLLLSAIINESIASLDFLPQENIANLQQSRSLTVYRLDFSAKIKLSDGRYKHVLIEIQKAKLPSDIMRFRRYLGEQYSKKTNVYTVVEAGETREKPLPIISIYFLGYALPHITAPVIQVNRDYYDVVRQQKIETKEDFIESLTHDSYVIQISQLGKQHQSDIEQLLMVFEQHKHLVSDKHILEINEGSYPQKYRPLIRRLQRAISEPEVRQTMDIEDEILQDLQDMERVIAKKERVLMEKDQALAEKSQALAEKDQALAEKSQALAEKDQTLAEKDQTLAEKDQTLAEKDRALAEKDALIAELKKRQP
jgi:hypothetical protein